MQISQSSKPCSSRKPSGDILPNATIVGLKIPSIPGFSVQQVGVIVALVQIASDQSFDQRFGPTTAASLTAKSYSSFSSFSSYFSSYAAKFAGQEGTTSENASVVQEEGPGQGLGSTCHDSRDGS